MNDLFEGDCLEVMKDIPDKSVDMILCDLPYGTTDCKWDVIIPFEPLWKEYNRIIKPDRCIALFGSEPFSTLLRMSNFKGYKYDWIWNKKLAGNGIVAHHQPLKIHELISIFNAKNTYYPIKTKGKFRSKMTNEIRTSEIHQGDYAAKTYQNDEYYPVSIQEFTSANRNNRIHPTQKPVALFEYLICTYTQEGETILDNCAGSGTTAIACLNTNRNYILIEKDPTYVRLSRERINTYQLS